MKSERGRVRFHAMAGRILPSQKEHKLSSYSGWLLILDNSTSFSLLSVENGKIYRVQTILLGFRQNV